MSLINRISNPGPLAFYDLNFRNIFEDHLSLIINQEPGSLSTVSIDPNTGARYAGDWRGLMIELGIRLHYSETESGFMRGSH